MPKKESNPQNKRQWVISITTVTILIAGFAYYFLGYVTEKEANLNERGFRILALLGENIEAKRDNEIKNAKSEAVKKQHQENEEEHESEDNWGWEGHSDHDITLSETPFTNVPDIHSSSNLIVVKDRHIVEDQEDSIFFTLKIRIEGFIGDLLREDLFDQYILLKEDTILYSTLKSGFVIDNADTILTDNMGFHVSSIRELEIGGIVYKVFLQPYQFKNNETWVIGGLIEKRTYRNLSMSVAPTLITLIFLLTALTILSIPFIKLLVMSALERLNTIDVVFAILAMVLGSSILVLILLHTYRSNVDGAEKQDELEAFTKKIADDFSEEIALAHKQLLASDKDPTADSAMKYPLLRQIFWTDATGQQVRKETTTKGTNKLNHDDLLISVGSRDYFKNNLPKGEAWELDEKSFALQSIHSWTIGQSMIGIGTNSSNIDDTVKVVALTSLFYSVIDPVIPQGYVFAIIDEEGNILLHADKHRNLQENLVVETEYNPQLQAAIYARKSKNLDLGYLGEEYNGFIQPVDQLPLFVVGLKNQEFKRTANAQILNFTLLHTFIFFGFFIMLLVLSRVLRFPKSRIKRVKLLYGWIWPLERNKSTYIDVLYINIFVTLLLIGFTLLVGEEEGIAMLYSACVGVFLIAFHRLNYRAYGETFLKKNQFFMIALGLIILAIILYSIHGIYNDNGGYWWVILFQGIILAVYLLNGWQYIPRISFGYRQNYVLMLVSWLFIVSIVPSILFYRASYNLEDEVAIKHDQLSLARELAKSTQLWSNETRVNHFGGEADGILKLTNGRGDIHVAHVFDEICLEKPDTTNIQFAEDFNTPFHKYISSLARPFYGPIVEENNDLVFDRSSDESWFWIKKDSTYTLTYKNYLLPDSNRPLVISSTMNTFRLPLIDGKDVAGGVIYWVVFILVFLVGLPSLLKFTVQRIFVPQPLSSNLTKIDFDLFETQQTGKNIFVIGLPHSGKELFLDDRYPENPSKLTINLIDVYYKENWDDVIENALQDHIKLVLVNHFEYNMENKDLTTKKLVLLEQLMLSAEKKIVVSASVHMTNIEELYSSDGVIDEHDKEAIYRWTELFKNFYEVYFPLQGMPKEGEEDQKFYYQKNPNELINELIEDEFRHGEYLKELRPEIIKMIEKNEEEKKENDHDQIILKTQNLSAVYYHSLWSTCTENEKYVIYDLAEDGLVNSKNYYTIESLLNKGLIIYNDTLQVMNESFRNFVLTKIGPVDALRMERKAKKTGTWSNFRNPMVIILLAFGVFILVTQQDSLTSYFSFLGPLIAIVPALVRILMMVGRRKRGGGDDDDD